MYDHRGNGRSDRRTPDEWNLDTWADDVVRLCDALGIEKPIVLGGSFGGFVAQRYLSRHPDHAAGVVLGSTLRRWSTEASVEAFRRLGGDEVAAVAAAFWTNPNADNRDRYLEVCGPLYTQQPGNLFTAIEPVRNTELLHALERRREPDVRLRRRSRSHEMPGAGARRRTRPGDSDLRFGGDRRCAPDRTRPVRRAGSPTAGTGCSVTSRNGQCRCSTSSWSRTAETPAA